jgi:glucokinase
MNKQKAYIGIDIGGTNTTVGLVDIKGHLLGEKTFPTMSNGPFDLFMSALDSKIKEIVSQIKEYPLGIGVGAPGANIKTGVVEAPENFNWEQINLVQMLTTKYNLPVKIMNDADAAALGEIRFGVAKNLRNFIHITLGTGVGSTTIIDGKIFIGHYGMAGELGHTKIYPDNRICSCGKRGCLETYVSGNGIKRTVFELLSTEQTDSELREYSFLQLSPKIVTDLALKGDAIAIKAYQYTGKILGEKLADLAGLLNPEAFVFSGGLIAADKLLFEPAKIAIEENLLQMHKNTVEIRLSDPDKNYAVLGAALLLMESVEKNLLQNKYTDKVGLS